MTRIAFSLRRLDLPVGPNDLVLEVGSGDNPYPRANVLVDLHVENLERWDDLDISRPFVLVNANHLPFATKSFGFIIASHVLEHTADPSRFLDELSRVGKAGYIECPHAFMEQIIPYTFHRLQVRAERDALVITKKPSQAPNTELLKDFACQLGPSPAFHKFLYDRTDLFYLCFYWHNKIDYVVTNPEVDCNWPTIRIAVPPKSSASLLAYLKRSIRRALGILLRM